MIKPGEIQKKARKAGVRDQQIEKDYVLSWILQGIAKHEQISQELVFKGGTVLKKMYFKNYRFSEDLDFTLRRNEISDGKILEWFSEVFDYIKEDANIPLKVIAGNEHHNDGINFYISYIGPLGGSESKKRVKVDISRSENLSFEPVSMTAILEYTDQETHQLLCYSLEEVLVEKLRSVMQRMQARDFYDIWYLLEVHKIDLEFLTDEFKEKCESKNLNPEDFHEKLDQRLPKYKALWGKSMGEQIKNLPRFEQVERETLRQLKKLT
jgi:predicted nucleotidyltransferase component of viral defense system